MSKVNPRDVAQVFAAQGYFSPIDVFTADETQRYRDAFNEMEAREGKEKCEVGISDHHRDIEFIWRLATHPTIVDCIEAIAGPNVMLLSTLFFCKYPPPQPTTWRGRIKSLVAPTRKFIDWHQDLTYWGLEPPYAVSAWIAIDDSDAENGCMRVIPGSHGKGIIPHSTSRKRGNLLGRNQALPEEFVDDSKAVDLPLRAGQVSLHHGEIFHGSNPNRSNRRRCGLAARYTHTGVRQVQGKVNAVPKRALLLRGVDKFNYFSDTSDLPFPLQPKPNS
jgi:non-heme Fe2+,alpha-ketoglutarate-dependent halogenase